MGKVQLGNLGDRTYLGNGVFELREHFGAGYRIYCGLEKQTEILLLCGDDKSSQTKDIKIANNIGMISKKVFKIVRKRI